MEKEYGSDAACKERSELVLGLKGYLYAAENYDGKEADHRDRADKTELLRYDGKNKNPRTSPEGSRAGTASLQEPLPMKPPDPMAIFDCMSYSPIRAVQVGIQENQDPPLLVVLEVFLDDHRKDEPQGYDRAGDVNPAQDFLYPHLVDRKRSQWI